MKYQGTKKPSAQGEGRMERGNHLFQAFAADAVCSALLYRSIPPHECGRRPAVRTPASQAGNAGSNPVARSRFKGAMKMVFLLIVCAVILVITEYTLLIGCEAAMITPYETKFEEE